MKADPIAALPPHACPEREAAFLDAARAGALDPIVWAPVECSRAGRRLVVYVTADALQLAGVRITTTHVTAQRLADLLGGHLLTSRIADLAHDQAGARLPPQTQTPDAAMSDTHRMLEHSSAVDAALARAGAAPGVLVADPGKDWVCTPRLRGRPDRAANFGWHTSRGPFRSAGGASVLQPVGLAHNLDHTDYSQVVRLVHADCELDGEVRPLAEIALDPLLHALVSDEGPVELRHPGVPALVVADTIPAPAPEASC